MANALQKIITTAKGLQRKNKNLSWKDAIKKASAMYRATSKPAKKKSVGRKPARKKAARKKSAPRAKHIDKKSHNVNIRVVSGAKKRIAALPVGFTGNFLGYRFKLLMQYQIDGKVTAQIVDSDPPGNIIAELNGNKSENSRAVSALISHAKRAYLPNSLDSKDETMLFKKVTSFVSLLNTEVSKYNSGKDTGKKKSKGAKIVIRPETKKAGVVQQIKTILRDNKKILTRGYKVKPGKIREKSLAGWNAGDAQKQIILKKIGERLQEIDRTEHSIMLVRNAIKTLYAGKDHAAHRKVLQKRVLVARAIIREHRGSISQLKKLL